MNRNPRGLSSLKVVLSEPFIVVNTVSAKDKIIQPKSLMMLGLLNTLDLHLHLQNCLLQLNFHVFPVQLVIFILSSLVCDHLLSLAVHLHPQGPCEMGPSCVRTMNTKTVSMVCVCNAYYP